MNQTSVSIKYENIIRLTVLVIDSFIKETENEKFIIY